MIEREFIELLRKMPLHDGAHGLDDDAAIISIAGTNIIFTKDMMAEGVHYFADADPRDVAWKLLAVNLSDLAAKGAVPIGVMLGFTLHKASGNDDWDKGFASGFDAALRHYDVPLLGGDTISSNQQLLSLTAIGMSAQNVPLRSGAQDGDLLYVSGVLGDAYAGYEMVKSGAYDAANPLVIAYNRPIAQLELGQKIAGTANAMMDISDGLLLDAQRMANASGLQVEIMLEMLPLSSEYRALYGDDVESIIKAATWGDDYQLLCAAHPDTQMPPTMKMIGKFTQGNAMTARYGGEKVKLPAALGYEHIE